MKVSVTQMGYDWKEYTQDLEVDEEDYFKSIDDVIKFITNNFEEKDYKDIKEQIQSSIEENKVHKFLNKLYSYWNEPIRYRLSLCYPHIIEIYNEELKPIRALYRENNIKKARFINENKDEVFNFLDNYILVRMEKIKESRKIANDKYYKKQKEIFPSVPKIKLTAEEKLERKKIANLKYYNKSKEVVSQDI